jgi:hypothetical protein
MASRVTGSVVTARTLDAFLGVEHKPFAGKEFFARRMRSAAPARAVEANPGSCAALDDTRRDVVYFRHGKLPDK